MKKDAVDLSGSISRILQRSNGAFKITFDIPESAEQELSALVRLAENHSVNMTVTQGDKNPPKRPVGRPRKD